jgi:hypothetical protein
MKFTIPVLAVSSLLIQVYALIPDRAFAQEVQVYYENPPGQEGNINPGYMIRKVLKTIVPGSLAEFCQDSANSKECYNIRSAAAFRLAKYNPNNVKIIKVEPDYSSGTRRLIGKKVTVDFDGDTPMVCPYPQSEDFYVRMERSWGFGSYSTCEYVSSKNLTNTGVNQQTTDKNQCMHEMMSRSWKENISPVERMEMFKKCSSL